MAKISRSDNSHGTKAASGRSYERKPGAEEDTRRRPKQRCHSKRARAATQAAKS